jgi:hypothetical protein
MESDNIETINLENVDKAINTVTHIYSYYNTFMEYMRVNRALQQTVGFLLLVCHTMGYITLYPAFVLMHGGLFFYTCREIIRYHSTTLENIKETTTQPIDLINIIYNWIGLTGLTSSYYILDFIKYYFGSYVISSIINYIYFNMFLYLVQDLKNYYNNSLPNIYSIKQVVPLQGNNNFNKLVIISINFYRVNMRLYDFIFLNIGAKMFYAFYTVPYESNYYSTDYLVVIYKVFKSSIFRVQNLFTKKKNNTPKQENVILTEDILEKTLADLSSGENKEIEMTSDLNRKKDQ